MKLCWEYLDQLRLTYKDLVMNPDGEIHLISDWGIKQEDGEVINIDAYWEYTEDCLYCGKDYLRHKNSTIKYCDMEHKKFHTKWKRDWERLRKQRWKLMRVPKPEVIEKPTTGMLGHPLGLKRGTPEEKEMRQKINEETGRIRAAPFTGIKGKARYDTYAHQVSWFEDTRRDPKDSRLLQVKCFNSNCKKWFTPPYEHVKKLVTWVNSGKGTGKQNKVHFSVLYCSNRCGNQCKLLRYQATRCYRYKTGKLTWGQYHEIPHFILHYNWQEELEKIHKKMRIKIPKERKKKKIKEKKSKLWKGRKWKRGEARPNPFGIYMCTSCRRFMGKDKFTQRNIRMDNISGKCKRCMTISMWIIHEGDRQRARDNTRRWAKNNPEKRRMKEVQRRLKEKDALDPTANNKDMSLIYKYARMLTRKTGILHEVDHNIPTSKGGKHHEDNLQVLSCTKNNEKSNKLNTEIIGPRLPEIKEYYSNSINSNSINTNSITQH